MGSKRTGHIQVSGGEWLDRLDTRRAELGSHAEEAWLVATDGDPSRALGIRLAAGVPGEWYETRLGRWPAYQKRLDPARHALEACQVAHALATYLWKDYWPERVAAAWRHHCPPGIPAGTACPAVRPVSGLAERIHAFVTHHRRVVIPGLVHVWMSLGCGGQDERDLLAAWIEGPAAALTAGVEAGAYRTLMAAAPK